MIYLQNISGDQEVSIPWNGIPFIGGAPLYLDIKSTINLSSGEIPVSGLRRDRIYAHVKISLPEGLPDGEYEYTLTSHADEDVALSTGLLTIGGLTAPGEYEKSIEYEQYTAEE